MVVKYRRIVIYDQRVTSAKKSGFAGVLRGIRGSTITRKQVGTTLLHGLAKGPTGPKSASGPVVGAIQVLWFPMSKVRHQGAAHPFPIRFLQSQTICLVCVRMRRIDQFQSAVRKRKHVCTMCNQRICYRSLLVSTLRFRTSICDDRRSEQAIRRVSG